MATAAVLVDTNILVYRLDHRFPEKQRAARVLIRGALESGSLRIAHQSVVEFIAATTKRSKGGEPLLSRNEAIREAEEILQTTEVLYPNEAVLGTALRGMAAYGLSWFDAHLWAYAEVFGIPELLSEDFQHGRRYGAVLIRNPFLRR
jgi:predicted nucleic acid-binding protein